mgnify:CR=1 FL=1
MEAKNLEELRRALQYLYQVSRTAPASADIHETCTIMAQMLDDFIQQQQNEPQPAKPATHDKKKPTGELYHERDE